MRNLYKGPSKDASYQISIHLAKWFQRRRFFRNQPLRNKNCLWWPCLLNRSELNEHSLERTFQGCFLPRYDSFGQAVSEKIFSNKPIRKKNCLWRPCLLMVRDKMCMFREDLPEMLPTKFQIIWLRGVRGED